MRKHEGVRALWGKLDKDTRQRFMRENVATMGNDLAKRMQETITEFMFRGQSTELISNSDFLDEDDMANKYKHKPEQLASIWENARSMHCPIRNVTVWQDPQFVLKSTDKVGHGKIEERKMNQEAIVALPKKAKVTAKPKPVDAIADVSDKLPPMLEAWERAKLQKLSQNLKDLSQRMTGSIDIVTHSPALQEMVPEYVINKAEHHFLLIQAVRSAIDVALDALRSQMLIAEGELATASTVVQSLDNRIEEAVIHKAMCTDE